MSEFDVYVPHGSDGTHKVVTINADSYGWENRDLTFYREGARCASFREWASVVEIFK